MTSAQNHVTTLQAFVSGMVQGVGFRFFVVREARRLGLAGDVRNLPDGRVEVRARGPIQELEELAGILKRGPAMSRVQDLDVHWHVQTPRFEGFQIAR